MESKNIGRFISERRKLLGISQEVLADWLDVTNKDISQWEAGETSPDITSVIGLAACLQVSTDELLAAKRNPKTKKELSGINSDFIYLCEYNRMDDAKKLWQDGYVDLSFTYAGSNALLMATQKGHVDMVNWLVEIGSPLDATSMCKKTALIHAVERGHIEIVKALINAGANPDSLDREGKRAMDYANPSKHAEIIGMLTSQKTDHAAPSATQPGDLAKKSLEASKIASNTEIADQRVIEVQKPSFEDIENLSNAVASGNKDGSLDAARYYISKGEDMEQLLFGKPLLAHAVTEGNLEMAKILIGGGANVDASGRDGVSLLHGACKELAISQCAFLLENGADPNKTDKVGNTPLHFAVSPPSKRVSTYSFKTNVSAEKSPTYIQAIELVDMLVKRGANLEAANHRGHTPFFTMFTLKDSSFELIDHLAGLGAIVDTQDEDGNTCLHYAVASEDENLLRLLLEKGADMHVLNFNGFTPYEFALKKKKPSILSLMTLT